MQTSLFYFFPFISAILGWLLGVIVSKVFVNQLLSNQQQIAGKVAAYASSQFSPVGIEEKLTSAETIDKILPFAEGHIDNFLRNKLPESMPMLKMFISDKLVSDMKAIFMKELQTLFPALITQYLANAKSSFSVENIITQKLSAIPSSTVNRALSKQIRAFQIFGAILGFVIGGFQILLTVIA